MSQVFIYIEAFEFFHIKHGNPEIKCFVLVGREVFNNFDFQIQLDKFCHLLPC